VRAALRERTLESVRRRVQRVMREHIPTITQTVAPNVRLKQKLVLALLHARIVEPGSIRKLVRRRAAAVRPTAPRVLRRLTAARVFQAMDSTITPAYNAYK
jgi:hypothetical protein